MDERRHQPPKEDRTRLSPAHAAHLLRLGAQDERGSTPKGATAEATLARERAAGSSESSSAGIHLRIGRTGASITLLMVSAAGFMAVDVTKSVQIPPNQPAADGSVSRSLRPASRATPGDPGASQPNSETRSMQKQFMGVAALGAALAVADGSHAQAVQWRVSDGGNGHWYSVVDLGTSYATIAEGVQQLALRGGEPCVFESSLEWFWYVQNSAALQFGGEAQFGLYRLPFGSWVTFRGDPIPYAGWGVPNLPNNGDWQSVGAYAHARGNSNSTSPFWEDYLLEEMGQRRWIVEWSADCNNDGIVDYGQCRDGSLPDYNCNNIPDCCETEATCALGRYPMQWCGVEGGNGHWYSLTPKAGTWDEARLWAHERGGNLASVTSSAEHHFIRTIGKSCWIGARKLPGQSWSWIDGSLWSFTSWCPGEPCCFDNGLYVFVSPAGCWDDHNQTETMRQGVIEWSADCNNDGIVDFGQILQGQLPDTNQNGVPDSCETPDCTTADLFRDFNVNGADLGILLAQWGPVNSLTVSDLNNDGAVDGIDLGLLLSFWGPCPG